MYLNRNAIKLEEATTLLESIKIMPKIEKRKTADSHNFILAENLYAPFPIPAFRRSGYDGYGILSEDDHDFPRDFEVMDNVGAGSTYAGKLRSGQTVRIMTGAKVPDEVGKVIMLELTESLADGRVRITDSMKSSNISKIGEEFEQGELLLAKGSRLNAGAISLLNAFGYAEIPVFSKPKVGILATGSELLKAGEPYEEWKIYNSNGPLLENLVKENGGEVLQFDSVKDDLKSTQEILASLTETCDLVITTGGVSVGDFDYMASLAKSEASEFLFNKLAMRPGSPTTAFVLAGTPVLALSGNPGACFTGFYLFAEPLIQRLQGGESRVHQARMPLAHDYKKPNSFDKFVRATVKDGKVSQVGSDKSSALGNLHLTTAFFRVPHDSELSAGEEVEVRIIP